MTDRDKSKDRDWDKEMRRWTASLPLPRGRPLAVGGHAPTLKKTAAAGGHANAACDPTGYEWLASRARRARPVDRRGLTQWPTRTPVCSRSSTALGGSGSAAGIWSTLSSWKHRLGLAHLLSLLVIIWSLALAAREVLPRIGYARAQGVWICPGVPAR